MIAEPETFESLKAPFPWFGGKSRAAELIWSRLGAVNNYVEPFAGSLAVLLARPTPPNSETINDLDCYLSNFWRAVAHDPAAVAAHADWPVSEADLHSRHQWLVNQVEFRERMKTDPEYFDVRIAGWWVWGLSSWIGGGWCRIQGNLWHRGPDMRAGGRGVQSSAGVERKRPIAAADRCGNGVNRKIPNVYYRGLRGVALQVPDINAMCDKGANNSGSLEEWFGALCDRLRRVRVVCGDWKRVLGPTPLGMTDNVPPGFRTGVVLDPPYCLKIRDSELYATEGTASLSREVRDWAVANGESDRLRIALCGYEGEHEMPSTWECVPWKAGGGYGNRTGNQNAHKERIWFSPQCLKPEAELF